MAAKSASNLQILDHTREFLDYLNRNDEKRKELLNQLYVPDDVPDDEAFSELITKFIKNPGDTEFVNKEGFTDLGEFMYELEEAMKIDKDESLENMSLVNQKLLQDEIEHQNELGSVDNTSERESKIYASGFGFGGGRKKRRKKKRKTKRKKRTRKKRTRKKRTRKKKKTKKKRKK